MGYFISHFLSKEKALAFLTRFFENEIKGTCHDYVLKGMNNILEGWLVYVKVYCKKIGIYGWSIFRCINHHVYVI